MEIDRIARLIALLEASGISELELTEGDTRLRIVRGGRAPAALGPELPTPHPTPAPAPPPEPSEHTIRAGFPGTFYRAPAPGAEPYVSEGDTIEEGQQLGILEAMKTMNLVEADRAGRILRIGPADGTAVEAGAVLFVLAP
ncbi:MAG: acetyl-CoA carboxylase biotin carboxyl carrier protein [Mesorhizobium amorphae]|nr:MAG: acetyl-CoA carboxylase biotin carboxyl carrier protein [Mesorhizobium amorphae]